MKVFYILLFQMILGFQSKAQNTIEKITAFPLAKKPIAFSTDIAQNLYVGAGKGGVYQYDSTGKHTAYHSPNQIAEVTALEARIGVRVYAFYQEAQTFTVFNRFLQPLEQYTLPAPKVGFVQNVAWGADQNVWLYDSQAMRILRYNLFQEEVFLEVNLMQILPQNTAQLEIRAMQEFDNKLYVFGGRQVWVLDYFGNLIHTIPASSVSCLYDGRLWQLVGKTLEGTSLYKDTPKKVIPFENVSEDVLFLHIHQNKVWTIQPHKATLWRLKSD